MLRLAEAAVRVCPGSRRHAEPATANATHRNCRLCHRHPPPFRHVCTHRAASLLGRLVIGFRSLLLNSRRPCASSAAASMPASEVNARRAWRNPSMVSISDASQATARARARQKQAGTRHLLVRAGLSINTRGTVHARLRACTQPCSIVFSATEPLACVATRSAACARHLRAFISHRAFCGRCHVSEPPTHSAPAHDCR
jgi:hypothetical protein